MQIVYFASVREAAGIDGEEANFPPDILTVADCLNYLIMHGTGFQAALADSNKLRFALDQQMVKPDASISGAKELAIFPPVTGG